MANFSSQITETTRNIQNLKSKLSSSQGVVATIVRVLFGGESPETIEHEYNRLNADLFRLRNQYSKIDTTMKYIYDFMVTYPPDWKERVRELKEMSLENCAQCGSHSALHAHHKIPLSRGGSNRLDNLILLCESCHKGRHNVKHFSNNTSLLAIDDRIKAVNYAISSKSNIEFLYKKPTDAQYSKRIVTPYRLKKVNHENTNGFTLCVEGFCHKRQEPRTFALKRMKNLKLH